MDRTPPARVTRVFVLHASHIVRRGVTRFVHDSEELEVIGSSGDIDVAAETCGRARPDVAIVGGSDPGWLAEGIRRIRAAGEITQVAALAPSESLPFVRAARTAGAAVFITLAADQPRLTRAIQRAATGAAFAWPKATEATSEIAPEILGLTSLQREVLALVGAGLPRKVIARRLGIRERTVKTCLSTIFAHLGVEGRSQAALVAQRIGLAATADVR